MGVVELLTALALAGSCPATSVHYQPTQVGTPWARSAKVTANLFYYTGATLMDARVNQSDSAVIYTGGRSRRPQRPTLLQHTTRQQTPTAPAERRITVKLHPWPPWTELPRQRSASKAARMNQRA
jgi:hypothetical protein